MITEFLDGPIPALVYTVKGPKRNRIFRFLPKQAGSGLRNKTQDPLSFFLRGNKDLKVTTVIFSL